MRTQFRIGLVVAISVVLAGCTVKQTQTPNLTGPSEFATSVSISANPDTVALGSATPPAAGEQSLIIATVFDAKGQLKPNQKLRFDTLVNGKVADCGTLSQHNLTTGSDGRASAVFTAPTPGIQGTCTNFSTDGSVTVRATAVGTDFQSSSSSSSSASLFMALPTFISPVGGFTVDFTISPNPGKPNVAVNFSDLGSTSPGHTITSYKWTWSDLATKSGPNVTHDFSAAGTYTATLTVTDDIGQAGFKTKIVTIEP